MITSGTDSVTQVMDFVDFLYK